MKSAQLLLSGVNLRLVNWSIQFLLPGWQLEGELVGICSGRLMLCPFLDVLWPLILTCRRDF